MGLKLNTFDDKVRGKARGIVLLCAAETYLVALISLAVLTYAAFILVYFVPQLFFITIPKEMLISGLLGIPVLAAALRASVERRDTYRLTLQLEHRYPQLRERLLTVMELGKSDWIEQNPFSRALARGLERDMSELMDRFAFSGAASFRKILLPAAVLLVFLMTSSVHAMVQPNFFKVSFERLTQPVNENQFFNPSAYFKKKLFDIHVIPGDSEIPRGSNLSIKAVIENYQPKKVELYYKKLDERAWKIFPMEQTSKGEYQTLLTHLIEDASYYVKADRQESRVFQIKIYETLAFERVAWRLEFPRYMNITEQFRQGWKDKVTVPEGTRVYLEFNLNQPIVSASLIETSGARHAMKEITPRAWTVDLIITKDALLSLDIRAKNGPPLEAPSVWVQVLPDLAPYLEVMEPQPHNYVYPTQEIPFELSVNDDYGVISVDLVLRYKGKTERISWLPKGPTQESVVLKPVLKLEDLHLESRDLVVAYIEVRDNYPEKDAAHSVRSSNFSFLIRDYIEQYKIKLQKNEEISLRQRFEDILVDQEKIMQDTWDYLSMPPLEGPKGWEVEPESGKKDGQS